MKYMKTFENVNDDSLYETIRDILDKFIKIGGAYKTLEYYTMDTKAGESIFSIALDLSNSFVLTIMFGDVTTAKKLTNANNAGVLKIITSDKTKFIEKSMELLNIIKLTEIEREANKYNL